MWRVLYVNIVQELLSQKSFLAYLWTVSVVPFFWHFPDLHIIWKVMSARATLQCQSLYRLWENVIQAQHLVTKELLNFLWRSASPDRGCVGGIQEFLRVLSSLPEDISLNQQFISLGEWSLGQYLLSFLEFPDSWTESYIWTTSTSALSRHQRSFATLGNSQTIQ